MRAWLGFAVAACVAAPNVAQAQHERADHVPPPPVARGRPDAGPEREPGREAPRAPYVRDDHWYGHAAPNDPRFHLDHPFEHGRFDLAGPDHRFAVARVDIADHRLWLAGGFSFVVAPWEWSFAAPWCWNCPGEFVVYDDPDHPGWYLLYNIQLGEYVHVQYVGA
jgi:hypothetical protein